MVPQWDEDALRSIEPPEPFDPRDHLQQRRRTPQEEPGLDVGPLLIGIFLTGFVAGGALLIFRRQARELELPRSEVELARDAAARGSSIGVSPREAVYAAVARVDGWASPGRVAGAAKVSTSEAELYLEDLAQEGRLRKGRDKEGRDLFKVVG